MKIDVAPGDESYISKIQSWVDRVSPKWIDDLEIIYLLNDKLMTNVVKNVYPSYPRPHDINGLFSNGSIVLRKRKIDGLNSVEGSFYHEVGHLIFSKRDSFERRKYLYELFSIWDRFAGRFSYYQDPVYADDLEEIFARVYSYWMLLKAGKADPIIDLPFIVKWAMDSMEEMFR